MYTAWRNRCVMLAECKEGACLLRDFVDATQEKRAGVSSIPAEGGSFDHWPRTFSRRSTVLTINGDTSNIWAFIPAEGVALSLIHI